MIFHNTQTRPTRRPGTTLLVTLILTTVALLAAVGIVVGLILMRWLFQGDQNYEFVYRRLEEKFGWTAVLMPVGFAFFVLWLILFLRQPGTLRQLFTGIGFPKVLSDIVLFWTPLAFGVTFLGGAALTIAAAAAPELIPWFTDPLVQGAVTLGPWAFYFLLIVVLSLVGICYQAPLNLISLGVFVVLAAVYVPVAYMARDTFSWWVVLTPFLVVGLVYVALTYERDAQSINVWWASFLGLLRCVVYTTLAFVFLLPGCQKYDRTETHSRVLVLVDVSGSMTARDGEARGGEAPDVVPTRQDKVISLLCNAYGLSAKEPAQRTFVEHLLQRSPVVFYRFGGVADKEPVFFTPDGKVWDRDQFTAWLNPDKSKLPVVPDDDPKKEKKDKDRREQEALIDRLRTGTDIAAPALEVVQKEAAAGNIQAVVIFSDGQRNKGGDEAVKELLERAANPKRRMHIITVGVGEYRQPVRIRLNPLRAPSGTRPDDGPFAIRVPVFGDGLADQKFTVNLWTRKAKDREGKAIPDAKWLPIGEPKQGQFKGGGDHPFDEIEFQVDLEKLTGIKAKEDEKGLLQGTWEFVAKIPRHARETGSAAEHVSDPATPVLVLDRKLRVLLFASGPSRDYQFARTMFYREVMDKRVDMSILLQTAGREDVDQDVDGQRLLTRFPDQLGKVDPENKYTNLKEYDVVISFDADWIKLAQDNPESIQLLKKWVTENGGSLIFIGGPIYTDRLARPAGGEMGKKLTPLFEILPVTLNDSVLLGLEGKRAPDRTRPWPLKFTGNAKSFDFLKLDEKSTEPLAGWNEYFWVGKAPEPGKQPKRGFFSYHPVESIKPTAEVLATFDDPEAPRIMDGKYEMPYLVSLRAGKGKTFYIGSGELWRLRLFKQAFYERFLMKLTRFVSAGGQSSKVGKFSMATEYVTGNIVVEAEVLDKDEQPLGPERKPEVTIVRPSNYDSKIDRATPDKVQLSAKKESRAGGVFAGTFPAETTGTYMVKLEIPGAEPFSHTFNVTAPNVEMGNLRTNFDHLHQLATEAGPLLERLDADTRQRVLSALERPGGVPDKDGKNAARLFFKLPAAGIVPVLLRKVPPDVNSVKGKFEDLWDKGTELGYEMRLDHVLMITLGSIGLLASAILFFLGRWIVGTGVLAGTLIAVLTVLLVHVFGQPDWVMMPIEMSTILGIVVGLLSVEWLTRKLLKLA